MSQWHWHAVTDSEGSIHSDRLGNAIRAAPREMVVPRKHAVEAVLLRGGRQVALQRRSDVVGVGEEEVFCQVHAQQQLAVPLLRNALLPLAARYNCKRVRVLESVERCADRMSSYASCSVAEPAGCVGSRPSYKDMGLGHDTIWGLHFVTAPGRRAAPGAPALCR